MHRGLAGLGEAGAQRARDGGHVQAAAVLVAVDDHCRQQQDLLAGQVPRIIPLRLVVCLPCAPCPVSKWASCFILRYAFLGSLSCKYFLSIGYSPELVYRSTCS